MDFELSSDSKEFTGFNLSDIEVGEVENWTMRSTMTLMLVVLIVFLHNVADNHWNFLCVNICVHAWIKI